MKLPLAYLGDPILRKKGERVNEINDEIRKLVHDMFETVHALGGLGLAAPQVHHSLALFVTCAPIPDEKNNRWLPGVDRVFINPRLFHPSPETWEYSEGCLSIPKLYENVTRPWKINVEATNLQGERFTQEFIGLEARAIMHENDHINGVLYIDRLPSKLRKQIDPILRRIKKEYYGKD